MKLLSVIALGAVTVGLPITTSAQHEHDHADLAPPPPPPPVVMTYRGEHRMATGRLHGQVELNWTHQSENPNNVVRLTRPGPDLRIDSILFLGAPLSYQADDVDSPYLSITLPRELRPGEPGFMLFTYSVAAGVSPDGDSLTLLTRFIPQVVGSLDTGAQWCEQARLPARTYAEISIDSSLRVYSGAVLLNEKEMLGMQPTASGVYENIMVDMVAADLETPYQPEFENGQRRYLLQVQRATNFSVLLGPPTRVDRVIHDSLTIDLVYPPGTSDLDAGRATGDFAGLVTATAKRLGEPAPSRLLITSADFTFPYVSSTIIALDQEVARSDRLAADVLLALARWWRQGGMPESPPEVMAYTALSSMFELFGAEATRTMRAMYHPDSWFKYRDRNRPTCQDSVWLTNWVAWFEAGPRRLHTINQQLADSAFWSAARLLGPGSADFPLPEDSLPPRPGAIWSADSVATDWSIVKAESKRVDTSQGWFVELTLMNSGPLALPVDIAVVSIFGDSVLTQSTTGVVGQPVLVSSPILEAQPFWVFLDPFRRLPEADRDDNLWRLTNPRRPTVTLKSGPDVLGDILFE